jgi:hypothetical protein
LQREVRSCRPDREDGPHTGRLGTPGSDLPLGGQDRQRHPKTVRTSLPARPSVVLFASAPEGFLVSATRATARRQRGGETAPHRVSACAVWATQPDSTYAPGTHQERIGQRRTVQINKPRRRPGQRGKSSTGTWQKALCKPVQSALCCLYEQQRSLETTSDHIGPNCKPEVTGSIPVRSTLLTKRNCAISGAFSFAPTLKLNPLSSARNRSRRLLTGAQLARTKLSRAPSLGPTQASARP